MSSKVTSPPANPLPGSAGRLSGIDVSSNNYKGDSVSQADAKLKSQVQGQKFTFVKATQGTDYTNPYFQSQWKTLGTLVSQGKMDLRVAYGFLDPGSSSDGVAQAKAFLKEVGVDGKLPAGTRLALDWEAAAATTPAVLKGAADYIHQVTGTWPIVYTNEGNEAVAKQTVPAAPTWVADYGPSYKGIDNEGGKILSSSGDTFDQYSDGTGYGASTDLNVFNGSEAALRKFAGDAAPSGPGLTATDKADNAEIAKAIKSKPLAAGADSSAAKALNRLLGVIGFNVGTSSTFGPKTTAALQQFQGAVGLPVTGTVDAKTLSKLVSTETGARVHPGEFAVGQKGAPVAQMESELKTLGYESKAGNGVFSQADATALKQAEADDKSKAKGAVLGKAGELALQSDVKALQHPAYRSRVAPSTQDTKLDAQTTAAAGQTTSAKGSTPALVGLGVGSSGKAVANIQAHLLAAGFDPKSTKGTFDDRTAGAVEAFQRKSGLPATGRVDPKTWAALEKTYIYTKSSVDPAQSLDEKSPGVLASQKLLRQLGYSKVSPSSVFDSNTEAAVKAFQKKSGEKQTGEVGKTTLAAMQKAVKELVPKEPTLHEGATGADVKKLQTLLNKAGCDTYGVDGQFGPDTLAAVMDYQYTHKLPVNGVVGASTWHDLLTNTKASRKLNVGGTNANQIAQKYLGDHESYLEFSGKLPMDTWVPTSEDCANFVSSCLQVAGKLPAKQHSDNVVGLRNNLLADGWKNTFNGSPTGVPLADAKPGDVVMFDGPNGAFQHTEIFNGFVDGKPQYIGSNNILSDGTQEISTDTGSWAYTVHVYAPPT